MTSKPSSAPSKARRSRAKAAEAPATWTTRDGRTLFVHEMEDSHLLNTMRYLERRIEEEHDGMEAAASYSGDSMAAYYAGQTINEGTTTVAFLRLQLDAMKAEIGRRKLDADRWCVACQRFHRPHQRECRTIACTCGSRHPKPVNDFHRKALGCSLS